jgi:phage baseplate assembly protein W
MTRNTCGLITPMRRDKKRDFAFATGESLALSHVRNVLLTEASTAHGPGELPWRCELGSQLHALRHAPFDAASLAMAQAYVHQAFARWLPHLRLRAVTARMSESTWMLDISFESSAKQPLALRLPLGGVPSNP